MDLAELQEIARTEKASRKEIRVRCCMAAGCLSANSAAVKQGLEKSIRDAGLGDKAEVCGVGCMRLCSQGPLVQVDPAGALYERVTPAEAPEIITEIKGGKGNVTRGDPDAPFFSRQVSVVLENSGVVEPERIESYIAAGGYLALYQALREGAPEDVIETITRSGLRGRGGAGYPTGLKWGTVAKSAAERRFVVCNADEGDPGAFMNRSELESDPHRILEGMAIAGYAVGASQGYIYIRGEYPTAIARLQTAIKQANRLGLLGTNIFESPFDFRIDLRIGAGAFVCGEETSLMASIEGQRGLPRTRPPYPAEKGLWGFPTLINNVETFANVAAIIRRGPQWYAGFGTEKSKGTKVFSLTGKVKYTGLVEVPLGTTLHEIVNVIGGGPSDASPIKAVQTGGPSGGCIPATLFDTPVDYESLSKLGSIMGSGGMIVMDETNNMVEVARFYMDFCKDESCGKCVPCRAGTVQLHGLLTKIVEGRADARDVKRMESLCDVVRNTSLCGLGQTAPNPVISTLRYFRQDYEALLQKPALKPALNAGSENGHV